MANQMHPNTIKVFVIKTKFLNFMKINLLKWAAFAESIVAVDRSADLIRCWAHSGRMIRMISVSGIIPRTWYGGVKLDPTIKFRSFLVSVRSFRSSSSIRNMKLEIKQGTTTGHKTIFILYLNWIKCGETDKSVAVDTRTGPTGSITRLDYNRPFF